MPIYEFRCASCRRRTTVLTLRVSEAVEPVCEHCGSKDLVRQMSRFSMRRSEQDRLDSLGNVDERDPKGMAQWMRRMGEELGDDGDDLDDLADDMEAGGDDDAGGDDW
jgi:putative FmdB family regulatory protein